MTLLEERLASYEPEQNIAVIACITAWNEEWDELVQFQVSETQLQKAAANAYRRAMPPLSGRRNIRDFVACVTKGLLVGAIEYSEGPKLLYAAQIAHATCKPRRPTRPPGRPSTQFR